MKQKLTTLARRYVAALREYLKQGPRASLQPAHGLGRKAIALGLETLDMARIHEVALATLVLPSHSSCTRKGMIKRAGIFFVEAITPIETTHRAARETSGHVNRLRKTLSRRTEQLAASGRHLKRGIVQRKAAEEALRKRGKHHTNLLEQSRLLQDHLRHLTHQILLAQDDTSPKLSRELHVKLPRRCWPSMSGC